MAELLAGAAAAQIANFYFMPVHLRVPYINVVGAVWVCWLSLNEVRCFLVPRCPPQTGGAWSGLLRQPMVTHSACLTPSGRVGSPAAPNEHPPGEERRGAEFLGLFLTGQVQGCGEGSEGACGADEGLKCTDIRQISH